MCLFPTLRGHRKVSFSGATAADCTTYTVDQRELVNHVANKPVNNHMLCSSDFATFCNMCYLFFCEIPFLLFLLCLTEAFLPILTDKFVHKENKIKT